MLPLSLLALSGLLWLDWLLIGQPRLRPAALAELVLLVQHDDSHGGVAVTDSSTVSERQPEQHRINAEGHETPRIGSIGVRRRSVASSW